MYTAFKQSTVIAVVLLVAGILIFAVSLIAAFSFSWFGVVTFVTGLGLLNVIQAAKAELNELRLENIELRKQMESIEKRQIR